MDKLHFCSLFKVKILEEVNRVRILGSRPYKETDTIFYILSHNINRYPFLQCAP